MSDESQTSDSPWQVVFIGLVLAAVGYVVVMSDGPAWISVGLLVAASVVGSVGVVGAGVSLGLRHADGLRRR